MMISCEDFGLVCLLLLWLNVCTFISCFIEPDSREGR